MGVLHLEHKDKVAVITIDHAPANSLSSQVIHELDGMMNTLLDDKQTKAIVIHGKDRFFSAGADIKEFTTVENADSFAELSGKGQALFNRIEAAGTPIIAAIHGAALGGGLELAMSCHIRVAAKGTKFGLPELSLGLIPGFAGTQRLPQLIGVPRATEMILSSEPIDADTACQYGLINHCVEEGAHLEAAMTLAEKIAAKSHVSVSLALETLHYARLGRYEEGQKHEAVSFGKAFVSEDAKEGIQAFIEKRKPVFKDK